MEYSFHMTVIEKGYKFFVTVNNHGRFWFKDSNRMFFHRVVGPAVEYHNGNKQWRYNDRPHREDGPAFVYNNGDESWYVNGLNHRIDGPAIIFNGSKEWWQNGQRHRTDGPAVEYASGYKEFYYYGQRIFCSTTEKFVRTIDLLSFA